MTDELPDPSMILQTADWLALENADGSAFPETPARLADLLSDDPSALQGALNHLDNVLLNDGVVYSATAPAVQYVAAILGNPKGRKLLILDGVGGEYPLRGKLLTWLSNVAYDVSVGSERRIRSWSGCAPAEPFPHFLEIRKLYPAVFPSVVAYLDDSNAKVREVALIAAAQLLEYSDLVLHRQRFVPLVRSFLGASSDNWLRRLAIESLAAWDEDIDSLGIVSGLRRIGDDSPNDVWASSGESFDEPPF